MSIVLFGGSFDPIHIGHMIIANEVNEKYRPDYFYFVPTKKSPLKSHGPIADDTSRVEMIQAAIKHLGFGHLLDFEILRDEVSYTYHTVQHIQQVHPNQSIYVVIGEDQYEQLEQWYQYQWLIENCTFIIANRVNQHVSVDNDKIQVINIPQVLISSTVIRKRISRHQTCRLWVIDEVIEIIKRGQLYES